MATVVKILPYLSPRLIVVPAPEIEITVQQVVDFCRDWEDDAGMSYAKLIAAAGKEPLGGGVSVGITATLQNAQVYFEARSTPISSGDTCSTANAEGEVLIATGATFVADGISRGYTVYNSTTGAMATVLSVDSETQLTMLPLTGGSRADWQVGDGVTVYNNEQCNISGGNLVAVDEFGADISSVLQSPQTQVVRTSSSSATLQELADIQYASYSGGVWYDAIDGVSGVVYPTGTERQPSNNLLDVLAISTERGFDTIYIRGDVTINGGLSYEDYVFVGQGENLSTFTIAAAANVTNCSFIHATVTGTLDGESHIERCIIDGLNFVSGIISECILNPTAIVLGGTETAHFLDCKSGQPGLGTPEIDCGGTGQALAFRGYNGGITLSNKSGSDDVSIDLASGQIILDATVTGGTIVCRGVGVLTDNSAGATVIDQTLNSQNIAEESKNVLLGTTAYP